MNNLKDQATKAVALIYEERSTPYVAATGENELAERIIQEAEKYDIPVQQEAVLVEALAELELGEDIPEQLYIAVAEVLAFAFALRQDTTVP